MDLAVQLGSGAEYSVLAKSLLSGFSSPGPGLHH
jgi:hypothetical protein